MTKKELQKLIRIEVQKEVYSAVAELLPELISEALSGAMKKAARQVAPQQRTRQRQTSVNESAAPAGESFDRNKLASLLGYGDFDSERRAETRQAVTEIAGVPVKGGLREYESAVGQAHLRDYEHDLNSVPSSPHEVEAAPAAGAAGPPVPDSLVQALGNRAKKVLDEAEFRKNWRPGMKRNG